MNQDFTRRLAVQVFQCARREDFSMRAENLYTGFCDDGGHLARRSGFRMTLTYALIANGGIILAADSQTTFRHAVENFGQPRVVGNYKGKISKIRTLRNGSAFSIAGDPGLVNVLLERADLERVDTEPFENMVFECSFVLQAEYVKAYPNADARPVHCAFLFCGYTGRNGKRVPRIVKLSSNDAFSFNPLEGFGFTGSEHHGGVLYLHNRLYSPGMPLDTAKCLAYCILSEVADLETTVGGPIEMAVVTESGVEQFTNLDRDRYELKRQEILRTVRSLIQSAP